MLQPFLFADLETGFLSNDSCGIQIGGLLQAFLEAGIVRDSRQQSLELILQEWL